MLMLRVSPKPWIPRCEWRAKEKQGRRRTWQTLGDENGYYRGSVTCIGAFET